MSQKFSNFPTCHSHPGSLDTASTPEAFAKREIELSSGTITVTDHGTMGTCPEIYQLAKKNKLIPIMGLEGYHRDDECDIMKAAGIEGAAIAEAYKYGHITMHFLDQASYEAGCRILSDADARAERHGSERKPLFTWKQLEELGGYNTTMTSSCLVGMVQRHLLADRPDMAIKYYERLRSIPKSGNFYVEVFPHKCDKNWVSGVFVSLETGEKLKFWPGKRLRVHMEDEETNIPAEELAKYFAKKHKEVVLLGQVNNRKLYLHDSPRKITNVEQIEDFIENECRVWCPDGDVQAGANRFVMHLARKYGDKIIIGDDSHYANAGDRDVQDVRLMAGGNTWRFYGTYNRMSSQEAWNYFSTIGVTPKTFESWIDNSIEFSHKFKDFDLKPRNSLPTSFYPQDTPRHLSELIKKHGRMNWSDPAMKQRLASEIALLNRNGTIDLLPYFFLAEEVCDFYTSQGVLSGVGRGSAAGLLIAYLLGITHANPLRYGLSKERFLTEDRIKSGKLPDIDLDYPFREILVDEKTGWLKRRFGENYVQISTNTMLRIRSSIKDVHRVLHGSVSFEIENLTKKIPVPPQGIDDKNFIFGYKDSSGDWVKGIAETDPTLKAYIAKYPKEWELVVKCLRLSRNKGRHASAFVIANEPIKNFIPLTSVGDVTVTQYTAPWVEFVGGLKMDFLVINVLNDLSKAIKLIQERAGYVAKDEIIDGKKVPGIRVVPHKGKLYDIWELPEDQEVYRDICQGKTETVFQFDTPSVRGWLREFRSLDGDHYLSSIEDLATFTSLDRPGPLDFSQSDNGVTRNMLQEYAARARGESAIQENKLLSSMIPETHGVITYQEQIQKVFQQVGKTTALEANSFREHISKKKMELVMKDKEIFMPGAIETMGKEEAERLWASMETFGQYCFNKSVSEETLIYSKSGPKQIQDFVPGDVVKGVDDNGNVIDTEVVALHDHGILEGFEVEFDDGYKIVCSENHKFLTKFGMLAIKEIVKRGLEVLCQKEKLLDGKVGADKITPPEQNCIDIP